MRPENREPRKSYFQRDYQKSNACGTKEECSRKTFFPGMKTTIADRKGQSNKSEGSEVVSDVQQLASKRIMQNLPKATLPQWQSPISIKGKDT